MKYDVKENPYSYIKKREAAILFLSALAYFIFGYVFYGVYDHPGEKIYALFSDCWIYLFLSYIYGLKVRKSAKTLLNESLKVAALILFIKYVFFWFDQSDHSPILIAINALFVIAAHWIGYWISNFSYDKGAL